MFRGRFIIHRHNDEYIENNTLCFHDMKNLSRRLGWIRVNNESARTSCLHVFSQAWVTDCSYHGNTIYYSVYYIPFLVFSRKKETEKGKKKQQRKNWEVIHRQTGNHIITSEICHCSWYSCYYKKVVPAKNHISLALSAHVHILRTLDCLLWRFTILYRIKLLRDLLTHRITTQKYNKPKIIIYLSKNKEPIRVRYSDNVTIVKHKYKP